MADDDSTVLDIDTMFADVEPIAQDDGPAPVVRIEYAASFVKVMGYFRRVLVDGEYSQRALLLSAEVIEHNAANYTAWQYRRQCIREMHASSSEQERLDAWRQELMYVSEQCMSNMKNYQVWFHRRACVAALSETSGELDFVATVLAEDSKNYHAWGHRQWVLRTYGLWAGELEYVDSLLQQDMRNNSAWNQRWFVLHQTSDLSDVALVSREVDYALKYMEAAPSNSSPWNYIKGLAQPVGFANLPQVRAACEKLAKSTPPCVHAVGTLVDVLQASGDAADATHATQLCATLKGLDPIRERYWAFREAGGLGAGGAANGPNPGPAAAAEAVAVM